MAVFVPIRRFFHDRTRRLHGAAFMLFALLAFITLYPLVFYNGERGAGYDCFFPHWAFWWTRHALTTEGLHLYKSNFVMFPYTTNYAYNVLTLFWFPVWAVLEPVVGTLTAVNVITLVGCTLNGYLFFVFLRTEKIAPGLALIGGVALQIFPIVRYFYYNTHINLMNWFLIPLLLLVWKQVTAAVDAKQARRGAFWAASMGLTLWATVLADLQFPIFAAFVLGPYGLYTLWCSTRRIHLILLGGLALSIAVVFLWFAGPLPYLDDTGGTLVPGSVEDRPTLDFPADFLYMAETWWEWSTPSLGAFVGVFTVLSLGLAVRSLRRVHDNRWVWVVVLLPPLLFAIGPTLTLGRMHIHMPYRLLYDATDGNYRMPWRLAPAFVIGAMMFGGKVWTPRLPRRSNTRVLLLSGAFFLLVWDLNIFTGGPLRPVLPSYETYQRMGEEPYEYVVLEAPTGAGSGEVLLGDPEAVAFQYYGITHEKRMVNGFISRAPVEHFWSLHTDDPMLAWLGQRRILEADNVETLLRKRIFEWPIGYVVVHQGYVRRNGAQPLEITGYFNSLPDLFCAPIVEGDAVFYRTRWHPDGCAPRTLPEIEPGVFLVDIGASGDERYAGWGWHWQETVAGITTRWAGDQAETLVYVDLPPGEYQLSISMQAFAEPRQVQVMVNGVLLGQEVEVTPDALNQYDFALPADKIGNGKNLTLALVYDGWLVPAEMSQSQDQRRLAVMVDWLRFTAVSD